MYLEEIFPACNSELFNLYFIKTGFRLEISTCEKKAFSKCCFQISKTNPTLIEGGVQWPKYITPSVQWTMDVVCTFLLIENVRFIRLQVAIEFNNHIDLNCRGIFKNHDTPLELGDEGGWSFVAAGEK